MELVGGAIYGAGSVLLEADCAGCFSHAGAYDWFLQTLGSLKGVKQGCDVVKCVLLKAPCGFSVNSGWEEIGRRLVGVMDKALVLEKTLEMMLKLKLQYFGHLFTGSTHSSTRGLSLHEQLARKAEIHSSTEDEA